MEKINQNNNNNDTSSFSPEFIWHPHLQMVNTPSELSLPISQMVRSPSPVQPVVQSPFPSWSPQQLYREENFDNNRTESPQPLAISTSSGKKSRDRWSNSQTACLVSLWRENFEKLKSSRARETWKEVVNGVNADRDAIHRSIMQCKEKMKSLIAVYKKAKVNNKRTGEAPDFPPFYEEIDSVLGCRDMMSLPEAKQIGINKSSNSIFCSTTQMIVHPTSPPILGKRVFESSDSDEESDRYLNALESKKAKKRDIMTRAPVKKNLHEEMLDIQRQQVDAFEKCEERHRQFMREVMEEQRKVDTLEREKDREFFLELGKLFSK